MINNGENEQSLKYRCPFCLQYSFIKLGSKGVCNFIAGCHHLGIIRTDKGTFAISLTFSAFDFTADSEFSIEDYINPRIWNDIMRQIIQESEADVVIFYGTVYEKRPGGIYAYSLN